jgi:hypothetical protein
MTTTIPTAAHTRTRIRRAAAVLGAAAATLMVWTVAGPLAGIDLTVRSGDELQHVGPAAVLATALLPGLAGWALLALLERITRRARLAWTTGALLSLAVSLAGPLASGVGTATKVALVSMHLVVAAVLIPGLARTSTLGSCQR